jgi:UDP-glucuronate 4-epimerase
MSQILVTGGAGFIGSHLCEKLLQLGHTVINIDNFNDFYDPSIKRKNTAIACLHPNYRLMEGDILDTCMLQHVFQSTPIDQVIHLAALAGVRKSLSSPLAYVDVDIKGTVQLLDMCRKYNIKKFIFASSSSVYGMASSPFCEQEPPGLQVSPYAAAKRAGELFCQTYNHLYGLPVVCLRFFTVYGPRQRPEMAIHSFTRLIDEGKEIPLFGDGTSSRDYTCIDDILEGIVASMELDCPFEIFNLGNSVPILLNDLVDLIGRKLGKPVRKKYLPKQPGDVDHTLADLTKAHHMLGYIPKVPIETGIEKFVHWYKKSLLRYP